MSMTDAYWQEQEKRVEEWRLEVAACRFRIKELEAENQRLKGVINAAIEYIGMRPTMEQRPLLEAIEKALLGGGEQ